jgi:hypothetical protein
MMYSNLILKYWNEELSLGWCYILDVLTFELTYLS